MNRKILVGTLLGCVAGGLLVSHVGAQNESPVAHSQLEMDALTVKSVADWNGIGHAFDNQKARLFWFTDLESAKIEAQKTGKPILSLRMLGNLSDELSCANSRFFRTALYPNAKINKILRENFVLHWSSERPVPVVTIDMGDGRVLKRTLTGNSAHYLMNSEGEVLDVLPGLYGPGAFEKWLLDGEKLNVELAKLSAVERSSALKTWHEAQLKAILECKIRVESAGIARLLGENKNDEIFSKPLDPGSQKSLETGVKQAIQWTRLSDKTQIAPANFITEQQFFVPTAEEASRITAEKRLAEFDLLDSTTPRGTRNFPSPLISRGERRAYGALAASFLKDARLDANSRALLLAKLPESAQEPLEKASIQRISQVPVVSDPEKTLARFEDAMAFDTARNEAEFHTQIHALFARGEQGDFQSLNRVIYDRLFLTPASDPWLGLLPDGVYNGLQNGGIGQTGAAQKRASLE